MIRILLICIGLLFVNCKSSQKYGNELEYAFSINSEKELLEFLEKWHKNYSPITEIDKSNLSEIVKQAYIVFEKFYNPQDSTIGENFERQKLLYRANGYIVIQNTIDIIITNKDKFDNINEMDLLKEINEEIEIEDFRPNISINTFKKLYFTDDYKILFKKYLLSNDEENGYIEINLKQKELVFEKVKFLNNELRIFPSHWLKYWYIIDHPSVSRIYFNKDITDAMVCYNILYQSCEAFYKRINSDWTFIKSEITFTE